MLLVGVETEVEMYRKWDILSERDVKEENIPVVSVTNSLVDYRSKQESLELY